MIGSYPAMNLCMHVGSGHSSPLFSVDKQQICTWLSIRIPIYIYISPVILLYIILSIIIILGLLGVVWRSLICGRACNSLGPSFRTLHIHSLCNIR